jgi:transcriptional regulator with XRE-family HTH domain
MDLKKRRKQLNMTQDEVASAAGISKQHYYLIEKGHITNITKKNILKLSQVLKTPVTELFFSEEIA